MKFPFFDLTRQFPEIKNEVMTTFEKLLDRQALVMGDAVTDFEKNIAQWMGVKHAITVGNGTEALILALKVLDIGPGDEVITPAFSFFASTGAILYVGAKPVFVDVDAATYNMLPDQIEKMITARTKAIMPVHLYGQMAEMGPILEIAKKHKLRVIEDYAQSIGARDGDLVSGACGDLGATSFYPTKNLGAAGEGGMITTNDDALADKTRLIRVHGMRKRYIHEFLGTNSRLDALQCAYLSAKLPRLNRWVEMRTQNANRYFAELAPLTKLGLTLPKVGATKKHVWNQFIITVPERDRVKEILAERGVPTEIYYPFTIPEQAPLRGICEPAGWPTSEKLARTSMALPIFPELKSEEQTLVIEGLKHALESLARTETKAQLQPTAPF